MLLRHRSPIFPQYYASVFKTCIARKAIEPGKQLHAQLWNSQDEYFLWNILIRGYAWNGPYEAAISLYYQLLGHGLVPDNFTFPFVLKACSGLSAIKVGREVHDEVRKTGWEMDVFVGAALIDMYAKCGSVTESRRVFDKIVNRDVVLWNSMLAAYSQNGHPEDCLKLCSEMVLGDFRPTEATLVTAIAASADSAAVIQGRELHGYSWRLGFEFNDKVNTGLVDMYAKSGNVRAARVLFEELTEKRLVSWNAMITGYGMHGHAYEALDLFNQMAENVQPDHITFVGVLSACNHGGLLDKGQMYFDLMIRDYCIEPTVQHYTCMVNLLGHFNRLDEAYCLITNMKVIPDSGVWGALLNSCKIHGNVELGELALERLIELQPDDAGNYVILSNIYAQAGKWEGVAKLRKLMTERKLKKALLAVGLRLKIYSELNELGDLLAEAGYIPDTSPVFYDVENDDKTKMVSSHSERLAIAFGLISTPKGTKILITKNLRVCEDCHVAIKLISKIKEREITIRDVNRYHHFKDGVCSCGDYW
ncbi:UNVERIFIED_CONTAM: Pentatricopeptide repeat-containing protein, chloroplastic [Sesamum angustifolium]|uniref:Pentatricopeptide repeat-containing protein, chloroplastic n=1 Tax=Sesamum angustifolium TaxID=2727405 RepID=A0AAW2KDD7_9LAMI